jgi:ABC-2 type transport system permease protein
VRAQIGSVARRSALRTLRQPAQIIPSLVFPLMLLAINASGLQRATQLPGFPTDSFLNRLALTPLKGSALLVGLLTGSLILGLVQAAAFLIVGAAVGAHFAAGVPGVLVIIALSMLITLGFGALGLVVALRTGSGEAVQGMFPVFFVFLFLSSMSLPRNLIQTDWFREIATYNPVSYLVEGVRSLLVTGWDGEALALGFGIAAAVAVVGMTAASMALRSRLVRT